MTIVGPDELSVEELTDMAVKLLIAARDLTWEAALRADLDTPQEARYWKQFQAVGKAIEVLADTGAGVSVMAEAECVRLDAIIARAKRNGWLDAPSEG